MPLLREPLIHFLLIGAAIFGLHGVVDDSPESGADQQIVITAEEVTRLRGLWERQWQRSPTMEELNALVDGQIREEVLYREALALGLDRDDTVVRRRLVQKFEFLTEDLAAPRAPEAGELRAYFEANIERYRLPPRLSFAQVYFSPDRRGAVAQRDAELALAGLRSAPAELDIRELGDGLMLENAYRQTTIEEVAAIFGDEFADTLLELTLGVWSGPVVSGYGLHLVRIDEHLAGGLPSLAEVEERVRIDWSYDQRRQANEALYKRLLARYQVTVEAAISASDIGAENEREPGS